MDLSLLLNEDTSMPCVEETPEVDFSSSSSDEFSEESDEGSDLDYPGKPIKLPSVPIRVTRSSVTSLDGKLHIPSATVTIKKKIHVKKKQSEKRTSVVRDIACVIDILYSLRYYFRIEYLLQHVILFISYLC